MSAAVGPVPEPVGRVGVSARAAATPRSPPRRRSSPGSPAPRSSGSTTSAAAGSGRCSPTARCSPTSTAWSSSPGSTGAGQRGQRPDRGAGRRRPDLGRAGRELLRRVQRAAHHAELRRAGRRGQQHRQRLDGRRLRRPHRPPHRAAPRSAPPPPVVSATRSLPSTCPRPLAPAMGSLRHRGLAVTIGWHGPGGRGQRGLLLGTLVDAGVPLDVPAAAVAALPVEPVTLTTERVTRHGLGATRVHVHAPASPSTAPGPTSAASWPAAALPPAVRDRALAVFERLAVAEGRVHRVPADEVHFHEVGALDALADVVGVVAGFAHLALDRLAASPVTLGSGSARARTASSRCPVPPSWSCSPAYRSPAGPVRAEMCTPTGAALLAEHVQEWTTLPPCGCGGSAAAPAAATRWSCPTSSGWCSARPRRRTGGRAAAGDQRRRPRSPVVARCPGRAPRHRAGARGASDRQRTDGWAAGRKVSPTRGERGPADRVRGRTSMSTSGRGATPLLRPTA